MFHGRKTWLATFLLGLGCLVLSGAVIAGGEKKQDDKKSDEKKQDEKKKDDKKKVDDKKKEEPKKGAPLLSKQDELKDTDEKDTHQALMNSPRKVYKLKLAEGKTYQFDLKSKDFDAVLRLEDPKGKEVSINDDFDPPNLDSRILYKISKAGEYKIIATCLDGKPGKFSLTVAEVVGGTTVSIFKGKAVELPFKEGKASYAGELSDKDLTVKNHYYKIFTIKLEAGKTYRIDQRCDDPQFDSFLFLEDADGVKLADDDDGGGGLNSRIVHKAAKTGVYRIITTTLLPKQEGKITLEVSPGDAKDEKEAHLQERLKNFADLKAAEQKELITEVTKRIQDKGEDLTINDARLAFTLATASNDGDIKEARQVYKVFIKAFSAASNEQVAGLSKVFSAALKKLDMIGTEIEITGMTTDGKDFDLKNLKGKVVLVDFWATWCGPCIAEIPNIIAAHEKYHKKGFEVIGVSLDRTDDAIVKFVEERKLPWKSINIEDSRRLADKYDVNAIPHVILVGRDGRVVSTAARGPQLERLLKRLLSEK